MDSTVVNIIVAIISAVVSGFLGWFISWFFSSRKRLIISQKTVTIIKRNADYKRLKVLYDSNIISELQYTSIIIKNGGNKTITKDMLIGKFLISLGINERIFECNIKSVSKDYIKPIVESEGISSYSLSFDLLEKNDEIQLALLHESNSIPAINAKAIETKIMFRDDYYMQIKNYYTVIIIFLLFSSMPIIFFALIPNCIKTNNITGLSILTTFAVALTLIIVFALKGYIKNIRELKKKREELRG